ncbi:MAG: response regulator [Chloroflexales bacterium]|nr:response regulator [Chloroflexales bacterium]
MRSSGSILIVDDDPLIRRLMASALQDQGCEVALVESGAEALGQAMARLPDLILLDVLLPDLDGIEVCRRVRAEPLLAEVPVIMITALNDPDARLNSLEAGADDFITKPVDFLELRARVSSILRLNRYRRLLDERTQRQRAEEETMRRNRELSLLNAFIISTAAKLRTARHIEDALHDACRILIQVLDLAAAQAWLLPEQQSSMLSAAAAVDQPGAVVPAILPGQSADQVRWQGDRSLLTMPLTINGRVSGAITLIAAGGRVFDGQEQAFVQSLAGALSQAIETALLHEQLQRHVDSLEGTVATRTNELQVERDRTQAILEALGEAVIVTDADWVIRYANPATTTLTGHSTSDLIGRSWSDIQGDGSTVALYRIIRDQAGARQTWRGEVTGTRRDGSVYDAAMTVAPISDPQLGERSIGLVSIQRDITPLKAAERMKDHFISNVSHELRTPLSIIALHSGNLDTLYDRLADEQRRRLIREVRAQAELLDELIGDVLELSRIDNARLPVAHRPLDLAALLRHEAERLQPLAERKGLRLGVRAAEALPVQGDEAHLRQCIRNLISNAIKFTAPGGTVCCECQQIGADPVDQGDWPASSDIDAGSWAGLRVVDSGVGIGAEHLSHLFERFYRVQNQSRVPGTGLGLAITRELITRHGGWTGVTSTPGVGSTFAFYLPLDGTL